MSRCHGVDNAAAQLELRHDLAGESLEPAQFARAEQARHAVDDAQRTQRLPL